MFPTDKKAGEKDWVDWDSKPGPTPSRMAELVENEESFAFLRVVEDARCTVSGHADK